MVLPLVANQVRADQREEQREAQYSTKCRSAYRLLLPRAAFFSLALFSPRAPVRGPFGAAFLRAARLIFLRSILSVMPVVFAMRYVDAFLKEKMCGVRFTELPTERTSLPAFLRRAVEIVL